MFVFSLDNMNTCDYLMFMDYSCGKHALHDIHHLIPVLHYLRILANRQSAQRSRVRKLQYISELERSVTSLQVHYLVDCSKVIYKAYNIVR